MEKRDAFVERLEAELYAYRRWLEATRKAEERGDPGTYAGLSDAIDEFDERLGA